MKHLVLATAPYGKGRGVDGGPTHVEDPRSALAEALVRELARAVGNGVSIGVERPVSGRAVVAALKGNLQHVGRALGEKLALKPPHGEAHLVGETILGKRRDVSARLIEKVHASSGASKDEVRTWAKTL